MKICWDNLENLIYLGAGIWKKIGTKQLCVEKRCFECNEPFLAWGSASTYAKTAKFCNTSCATSYRNKNRTISDETKRKISNSLKGQKNPNFGNKNIEHSIRMTGPGNPMFGKTHNIVSKSCISYKAKIRLSVPENNPNFGNGYKIRGRKNPNWRGGISFEPYCFVFKDKDWRSYIYKRDKEKFCWNPQCSGNGTKEVLHHINYDKKDCRYSNIIKICNSCNSVVNFNREWWQSFFEEIMCRRNLMAVN